MAQAKASQTHYTLEERATSSYTSFELGSQVRLDAVIQDSAHRTSAHVKTLLLVVVFLRLCVSFLWISAIVHALRSAAVHHAMNDLLLVHRHHSPILF